MDTMQQLNETISLLDDAFPSFTGKLYSNYLEIPNLTKFEIDYFKQMQEMLNDAPVMSYLHNYRLGVIDCSGGKHSGLCQLIHEASMLLINAGMEKYVGCSPIIDGKLITMVWFGIRLETGENVLRQISVVHNVIEGMEGEGIKVDAQKIFLYFPNDKTRGDMHIIMH